jgi:hypothetical protein
MKEDRMSSVPVPTDRLLAPAAEAVLERRVAQARRAVAAGRPGFARFVLARALMTAARLDAQAAE